MCLLLILNDVFRRTTPGPISRTYLDQAGSGPRSRAVIRLDWARGLSLNLLPHHRVMNEARLCFYPVVCCWSVGSPPEPTWRYLIRGSQSLIHQAYPCFEATQGTAICGRTQWPIALTGLVAYLTTIVGRGVNYWCHYVVKTLPPTSAIQCMNGINPTSSSSLCRTTVV